MSSELNGWIALHSQLSCVGTVAITPDNRGMAYADGFFTTMAVLDGKIVWQEYHQQRLLSHAQALQLIIDSESLLSSLQLHAKQLQQGMMKVIITRAPQNLRGYSFSADKAGNACEMWLKSTTMVINTAEQLCLPNGCTILMQPESKAVCLTSQLACLPPTLAGLKTLNRLDNVLASGELQRLKTTDANIGEGLTRDMTGCWVEGTMSNVFYQLAESKSIGEQSSSRNLSHNPTSNYLLNGQWFTPPMTQSGVAGVMRQVLIDALAMTDKPVIMQSLTDDNLPHLSRLFFCNAVRGVMPASELTLLGGDVIELSL